MSRPASSQSGWGDAALTESHIGTAHSSALAHSLQYPPRGSGGQQLQTESRSSTPQSLASSQPLKYDYASSSPSMAHLRAPAPSWEDVERSNALTCSVDLLPQPYRMLSGLLNEIIDGAVEVARERAREGSSDGGGGNRRRRGIIIEGEEEEEEPPLARVQFATQPPITTASEMPSATPTRIVTPLYPPAAPSHSNAPPAALVPSLPAAAAALSLDGKVAVLGSRLGALYVADLARSYAFSFAIGPHSQPPTADTPDPAAAASAASGGGAPFVPVSAVAVSPLPILRGDEDPLADEMDTQSNYLVAWVASSPPSSSAPTSSPDAPSVATGQTIRVATLNATTWQVFEGCSIPVPASFPPSKQASISSALLGSTSPTAIAKLQFAQDGSHISASHADGSVTVWQLRPHRFDPLLAPVVLSQKEQLLGGGKGTGASRTNAASSAQDLNSILTDFSQDINAHGLSFIESRSVAFSQAKLYSPRVVLHAAVPKKVVEAVWDCSATKENMLAQAAANAAAAATATTGTTTGIAANPAAKPSATAPAADSSTLSPTPAAGKPPTAAARRSSLKMDASAAAAALAALSLSSANKVPVLEPFVPLRPLVQSDVYFIQSLLPRSLGAAPSYATTSFIVVWRGDTNWYRWELPAVRAVAAGESPAALEKRAKMPAPMRPTTPGSMSPAASAAGNKSLPSAAGGSKASKEKDGGGFAAQVAAAAAASLAAEAELFRSPTPPAMTTVTGSPITASALDVSSNFLAVGLASGSVMLYDLRLKNSVRIVMNGTPALSHALSAGSHLSPNAEQLPSAITSLAFFNQSHLVAGTQGSQVRVFTLPGKIGQDPPSRAGAGSDMHLPVRISAKLPGAVRSVHVGTRLPVAVVAIDSPRGQGSATAPATLAQELYLYDLLSNYFFGKLVPPPAPSSTTTQRASPRDASPAQPDEFDAGATGDFTVHEHKENGDDSARSHTGAAAPFVPVLRPSHFQHHQGLGSEDSTARDGAAGAGAGMASAMDSFRARAQALSAQEASAPAVTVAFHALSSCHSPFPTLHADQLVLLASTTAPNVAPSSALVVFSLPEILCAAYPHIVASCSNAFLRQQHSVAWFAATPSHAERRKGSSFTTFLEEANRAVARQSASELERAFGSAPGRSIRGSVRSSPQSSVPNSGRRAAHHHGASGSFHPTLSSIRGSVSGSSAGSVASSLAPPPRSLHARTGSAASSASSYAHSRTGSSHVRKSSRSRERAAKSSVPPAPTLPDDLPRDASFVVSSVLTATLASSAHRSSTLLKARRSELQLEMAAQQKQQQQAARFQPHAQRIR